MTTKEGEGKNLLGTPIFRKIENGRFKCVETGHELPAHARDSYAQSKHCRPGLIDAALSKKKPPLNMFRQDAVNRSKLVCKLTGIIINKSEEHIWKHINGKRFLNMLDKKELEKETVNGTMEEQNETKPEKKSKPKEAADSLKKKKKKKEKEVKDVPDKDSNAEEAEFWMPAARERWGSGSGSDSAQETDGEDGTIKEAENDSKRPSKRPKRISIALRKKKRTKPT